MVDRGDLSSGTDCHSVFVDSVEDLRLFLSGNLTNSREKACSSSRVQLQEFDHLMHDHLSTGNPHIPTVILYADFSQPAFGEWHSVLRAEARKRNCIYALRHSFMHLRNETGEPTYVGGWGVGLDIKNMEYKTLDDRAPITDMEMHDDAVEEAIEEDMHGFYFHTLHKRYPDLVDDLSRFRQDLAANESAAQADLKVWDLKDLGLQAVQHIIGINPGTEVTGLGSASLKKFVETTANFPSLMRWLSRTELKDGALKQEVDHNSRFECRPRCHWHSLALLRIADICLTFQTVCF